MAQPYLSPSPSSPPRRGRKRVTLGVIHSDNESTRAVSVATSRLLSASEVARNIKHFETWATHQGCEQVALSDLPEELGEDVAFVFNLSARIPSEWIDTDSSISQQLKSLSPNLLDFLKTAHNHDPELFSNEATYSAQDTSQLLEELTTVRLAWSRLKDMRQSGQKWSEADYAANVYNMFRSPAMNRSTYRYQCSISLPQPHAQPKGEAHRILHPKNAIPDCITFIKGASIRHLSHSLKSPYKVLNGHPSVAQQSRLRLENSFRFQATVCTQPPETASFEFVSSIWEDKKPSHELLGHAYRQNRMGTAAAVRMLYSLDIHSCVFGLVWADGSVRAHVDWGVDDGGSPKVYSAPYPGPDGDNGPSIFREWNLDQPSDILQVYFLLRNIDLWTANQFRKRVTQGVEVFSKRVLAGEKQYLPWKRLSEVRLAKVTEGKENEIQGPLFPSTGPSKGRGGGRRA